MSEVRAKIHSLRQRKHGHVQCKLSQNPNEKKRNGALNRNLNFADGVGLMHIYIRASSTKAIQDCIIRGVGTVSIIGPLTIQLHKEVKGVIIVWRQ